MKRKRKHLTRSGGRAHKLGKGPVYGLAPKNKPYEVSKLLLGDPALMKTPPLTVHPKEALLFKTRGGPFKLLRRSKTLRRSFRSQRVA